MTPFDLLLYCLAPLPALTVASMLVSIVRRDAIEARATAQEWPRDRPIRERRRAVNIRSARG